MMPLMYSGWSPIVDRSYTLFRDLIAFLEAFWILIGVYCIHRQWIDPHSMGHTESTPRNPEYG